MRYPDCTGRVLRSFRGFTRGLCRGRDMAVLSEILFRNEYKQQCYYFIYLLIHVLLL